MSITVAAPPSAIKRALTVRQFCAVYGLGRSTTYELIASKQLPDLKIGGRRLIPVDAAERLLRQQT